MARSHRSVEKLVVAHCGVVADVGGLAGVDIHQVPQLFLRELSRYEPAYFKHRAQEEQNELMGGEDYKDHYYQSKFGWGPDELDKRRQLWKVKCGG